MRNSLEALPSFHSQVAPQKGHLIKDVVGSIHLPSKFGASLAGDDLYPHFGHQQPGATFFDPN